MNSNQPNPTTGEWTTTADKDGDCAIVAGTTLIGVGCTVQQTLNIVATHNAALAADRCERCEVCNSELSQCGPQGVDGEPSLDCLVCKLREQLAAEQRQVSWMRDVIKRQEQQLAAERELYDNWTKFEREPLKAQLAAEQSKLRDAEILCADLQRNRDEIHQQLAAALEALKKIQELVDGYNDNARPAIAVLNDIDAALAKLENK